jgi:hypothetical protein
MEHRGGRSAYRDGYVDIDATQGEVILSPGQWAKAGRNRTVDFCNAAGEVLTITVVSMALTR